MGILTWPNDYILNDKSHASKLCTASSWKMEKQKTSRRGQGEEKRGEATIIYYKEEKNWRVIFLLACLSLRKWHATEHKA